MEKIKNEVAVMLSLLAWLITTVTEALHAMIDSVLTNGSVVWNDVLAIVPDNLDMLATLMLGALTIRGAVYTKKTYVEGLTNERLLGMEQGWKEAWLPTPEAASTAEIVEAGADAD